MSRGLLHCICAAALALWATGCGGTQPVTIWADPALKGALDVLEKSYKAQHIAGWHVEYKEAKELVQVGTPAPDVVVAADPVIRHLVQKKLVDESTSRTFAGDLLAIVTPRTRPVVVPKVGDLPITPFKSFGLADKDTSLGQYSEQALISDGAFKKIEKQLQRFASTADLLAALRAGTVQLGLIYASTAANQPDLLVACTVPEDLYDDIRYGAACTISGAKKPAAIDVLKLLSENADAQKTLGAYGYQDRKTALQDTK